MVLAVCTRIPIFVPTTETKTYNACALLPTHCHAPTILCVCTMQVMLHNFGGNNEMFGALPTVAEASVNPLLLHCWLMTLTGREQSCVFVDASRQDEA